jgi:hypothetical protein
MDYFTNFHGQLIPYEIGAIYIYPNDKEEFRLLEIDKQLHRFKFDKNQWCTDLVFIDLIYKKNGKQVFEMVTQQLKLFE